MAVDSKEHQERQNALMTQVEQLEYLQEKLSTEKDNNKEVRIFMAGVFDMMHYGHANAFRLAQSLGTHLVVGIHCGKSILEFKGRPLMSDQERIAMVESCKFVDQIVTGVPYIMDHNYIQSLVEQYDIDYVIHGDDPCIVNGSDIYSASKELGLFRTIPRTEGVSTTDLLGRLLSTESNDTPLERQLSGCEDKSLMTTRMLQLFQANGTEEPAPGMKVVYVDGAFDMFHCGHVATLKAAKERGDYLIVGVHSDHDIHAMRGLNLPLMDADERALSVLGCRYVDKVLWNAPRNITQEWIDTHNISLVVRGTRHDEFIGATKSTQNDEERYQYPREAGIMEIVETPSCDFHLQQVIKRIRDNQVQFQAQVKRKTEAETNFFTNKYG